MTERSAHDQFVDAVAQANPAVTVDSRSASRAITLLRGKKSTAELERIRIASEISARGHLAAFRLVQPGVAEFELQAAAEGVWRREGADGPSYGSIVGSGPNSTTLVRRAHGDGLVLEGGVASVREGPAGRGPRCHSRQHREQ
jgi:Xaa-Pro aminopeptidase